MIPMSGEVAWKLPEGNAPYLHGRITKIDYEFAAYCSGSTSSGRWKTRNRPLDLSGHSVA